MYAKSLIIAAALFTLASFPVYAQPATPTHTMTAPAATGNPDVDFVKAMIPHHEAAVKMSEDYIKTAKDPVIKRLAQQINNSQQNEIETMKKWLEKNGPKAAQ